MRCNGIGADDVVDDETKAAKPDPCDSCKGEGSEVCHSSLTAMGGAASIRAAVLRDQGRVQDTRSADPATPNMVNFHRCAGARRSSLTYCGA